MPLNVADLASRTTHMPRKNWIKAAIKHPGRERERAKEHGVSTHAQMEKDSHSSKPSLRKAGSLGLRLSSMSQTRKKSPLYDHPRSRAQHG